MTDLVDNLTQIRNIISEIEVEDPVIADILREGFGLSLNLIKIISEGQDRSTIDVSEHIQIINKVLGISLEDLVTSILQSQNSINTENTDKTPDQETLEFITSDLDDYEKFLAKNKSKENLDFLSKNI